MTTHEEVEGIEQLISLAEQFYHEALQMQESSGTPPTPESFRALNEARTGIREARAKMQNLKQLLGEGR